VIEWNELLQATIPPGITIASPRYYAMLHVAMFDAINAINGSYSPFRAKIDAPLGASTDAAAAQAGRDILVSLIPASQATYDAALAARLATLPAGPANQGVRVGQAVARQIILWRRTDGTNAPRPTYVLPPFPGLWQPTPPAFAPAGFTLITPPYPSHSGNMACAGASAARALALGHGTDDIAFTVTWFGLPATDTTPATPDV
jgi:hypothetical protein